MKKLSLLLISAFVISLTTIFPNPAAFAELPIPNLEGTWRYLAFISNTNWDGTTEQEQDRGLFYIYQEEYQDHDTPNLTVVPGGDPGDPFQGFVQGTRFSFYKNNQHCEPNLGREIIVGRVARGGSMLIGAGKGFDSNPDWGSTWSYWFRAFKISPDVP